ncbi:MAG: hypothetical protein Q8868_01760 [Bacteroidota bacterium]|nr:hypothetical protein [Bacteroidota bacterium]
MRRLISIPLLILISFSGIRISIAYHFCGGKQVAARISLADKLASCGMEDIEYPTSPETSINTHCCNNVLSEYTFCDNYLPVTHVINLTAFKTIDHQVSGSISEISINRLFLFPQHHLEPPGTGSQNTDLQSVLCVFRI